MSHTTLAGPIQTALVSLDDVRRAAAALRRVAVRTPLLQSAVLEEAVGIPVFLKAEPLQHTGSFKFRGAYWYVSRLTAEQRAHGLVAPSSGNHGQAVAAVAAHFGVKATIVMPTTASRVKREGTRALGARVVFEGTTSLERLGKAEAIRDREGALLVPPFDDRTIIEGQGTLGLEIAQDLQDGFGLSGPYTVLVPVGGGGLAAGVAAAVKQFAPTARVVGVEPEGAPKLSRAFAAGAPVTVRVDSSALADGLLAVRVGSVPFEHHKRFIDDVVSVGDAPIARAIKLLLGRHKLLVEPSGAITVAALLERIIEPVSPVVCVISGGNIALDVIRTLGEEP